MILPLIQAEATVMPVCSAAEALNVAPYSVAVGSSAYVSGPDIAEVVQRVFDTVRALRLNVADDTVAPFVPSLIWSQRPEQTVATASHATARVDFLPQSPSVVAKGPVQPLLSNHGPRAWHQVLTNTASVGGAQVYLSYLEKHAAFAQPSVAGEALWFAESDQQIADFVSRADARVTENTADRARAVLRQFSAELPAPQVKPSVDGDVLFLWYNHGDHVEVNLGEDGYTSWFGKFAGVYEPGDEIYGHAVLPPSLEEMLRRLHG